MELKEYLKKLKDTTGETAEKFAARLCITKQHLSKISNKAYAPSRLLAKKIEVFTNGRVTCLELLYPDDMTE